MSSERPTIIYTLTDEAPRLATGDWRLATGAFLPIIRAFANPAEGVRVRLHYHISPWQ